MPLDESRPFFLPGSIEENGWSSKQPLVPAPVLALALRHAKKIVMDRQFAAVLSTSTTQYCQVLTPRVVGATGEIVEKGKTG